MARRYLSNETKESIKKIQVRIKFKCYIRYKYCSCCQSFGYEFARIDVYYFSLLFCKTCLTKAVKMLGESDELVK